MRRMMNSHQGGANQNNNLSYSLTLLLTCFVALAQAQNPINPIVPKALYLVETEHTQKALTELEEAVKANPTDASLLYYLGFVQIKAGENAKALASFDKGILLNEKEALNFAGKGQISLLEKKEAEAKIQFDKALSMTKSKNVAVLKAVAEAYLIDNKYSVDAITLLNKAKSADNTDPEVQILFGDVYLLQNNGGLAVSSYERAASLRPTMAKPHFKMGMVFERSKNTELAMENFNKAIAVDPKYTLAYKELGEIYYLMGAKEAERAVKSYETYLSLTEKPEAFQYQYAFFLFMAKDYKKANEVFSKIAGAPDVKVHTLRFYANSLFEEASATTPPGDFQKSKEMYERYFKKAKPGDLEATDYVYYGKALQKLKQDSLAIIEFNKSLAINSDDKKLPPKEHREILLLVGDTYLKTKKFSNAIEIYKLLMSKREAPYAADFFSIGRAYYFNTQFAQADTAFLKLIELKPEMTVGYLWEARTKSNLDPDSEQGLAKPYFEKLIEKASAAPDQNKNNLIDAYRYLGYYHYLKKDYAAAKEAYGKLLVLKPDDKDTKDALDILNKPIPQPQSKKER